MISTLMLENFNHVMPITVGKGGGDRGVFHALRLQFNPERTKLGFGVIFELRLGHCFVNFYWILTRF
jgi:hypothetical protein